MAIHVTPIPKLTEFGTPDLTLGLANAAGSAGVTTTIRTDATLLAFDTTVVETNGTADATGDATTASRRNHVHLGRVLSTIQQASRSASAGAGTQSLTGAGFAPTAAIVFAAEDTGSQNAASWGFIDDANGEAVIRYRSDVVFDEGSNRLINISDGTGPAMSALATLTASGIDIVWTKSGAGLDVIFNVLYLR